MTDEATPDTGTDATVEPEPEAEPDTVQQIAAIADELGITPGQLKGRLEASKKWEARAKKAEQAAEAAAQAARQESMTEQERAVETARNEARAAVLAELGETRVGDAFRVAAAGRNIDIDTLLEGVNLKSFLDEDGNPDTVKVGDWVERIAPLPEQSTTPSVPDLGQGARPTPPGLNSSQLQKDLMAKLGIS